jgi:hypothetical protein
MARKATAPEGKMSEGRWEKLAQDLRDAGFDVRIDAHPYSESYRGRVVHGISRSISFRVPGRGMVTVHDKQWNKNPDVWVGYEVCAENRDGIIIGRASRWTKKRSEAVAAFIEKHAVLTGQAA